MSCSQSTNNEKKLSTSSVQTSHIQDKQWVRLNVGGAMRVTTRATLTKYKDSMLSTMFSTTSPWDGSKLPMDENGAFLIDSDPKYFDVILNFLRRGELIMDEGVSPLGVLAEARYFGLRALESHLGSLLDDSQFSCSSVPKGSGNELGWEDIGGLGSVKRELQSVIELSLAYKTRFDQWGVCPSRNILLYGPPGCGKTLLAKVTANQIKANFLLVKCPELLNEPEHAVQRIQDRFRMAKKMEPCVIFFEEFECIAQTRDGCVESHRLISQLSISLDTVSSGAENIFIIAATNRPDLIEPALLRPGRFDQLIYIPLPDRESREQILKAALKKVPIASDVDLAYLASKTRGLSGADLKEVCQRACKFAIRESIEQTKHSKSAKTSLHSHSLPEFTTTNFHQPPLQVTRVHFEQAMGYSRRSVSDSDVYRHVHFNNMLLKLPTIFHFPTVDEKQPTTNNTSANSSNMTTQTASASSTHHVSSSSERFDEQYPPLKKS